MILAVDIGGTGLRAGLLDARARPLALHHVPLSPTPCRDGGLEIDPTEWCRALKAAADALRTMEARGFAAIRAIAVTGMTRTQVFLDEGHRVLRPALLPQDARASAVVERLKARCPAGLSEVGRLDAFHPLARFAWLAESEPDIGARVGLVLEPKDFIGLFLTGVAAGDPVSMARLAVARSSGLLAAADLPGSVLPTLQAPATLIGTVRAGFDGALADLAGLPLVMLAHDTWTAVLGLGALRPGIAYVIAGTSEVTGLLTTSAAEADGLVRLDWGEGLTQIGGPSQAGGDTLDWVNEAIGVGQGIDTLLAGSRSGQALLFLPWLRGERAPFWDADRRGAFVGLSRAHTPADLAWAVLEGIAHVGRLVLARAEQAAGAPTTEIRVGGGGARLPRWTQLRADILGRPVIAIADPQPGLRGAALAALTALGDFPDLAAAQAGLPAEQRAFVPDPNSVRRHDRLHDLFRAADAALLPIAHELARGVHGMRPTDPPPRSRASC